MKMKMKQRTIVAIAGCLVAAVPIWSKSAATGKTAWRTVSTKLFRVSMPGAPRHSAGTHMWPDGDEKEELWIVGPTQGALFTVNDAGVPAKTLKGLSAREILRSQSEGFIGGKPGDRVSSRKDLSVKGHPGLEVAGSIVLGEKRVQIKTRAFLIGRRLITLNAVTREQAQMKRDGDRFLRSLAFKK